MSNAWYLKTGPNMNKITTFFSENLIYEKIAINYDSILFALASHGTQYKEKFIQPLRRNVQARTSGWTDRLDPLLYSPNLLRKSGE